MADPFDPYHKWLGISPKHQPPDHYRLLGLGHFETDADVIDMAANRQLAHVRTYQNGPQGPKTHKILNEIAAARLCLLDPSQKLAYDRQLRDKLEAAGRLTSEIPLTQVQSLVSMPQPAPALLAPPEPILGVPISSTAGQPAAAPSVTRWKISPEMESPATEDVALVPLPVVAPLVVIPPLALTSEPGNALPRLNLAPTVSRPPREQAFVGPVLLIAGLSLTAVACVVGLVLAFSGQSRVAERKSPAPPSDTSFDKPGAHAPVIAAKVNPVPVPAPANPAPAPAPAASTQNPTPFPLGGAAAPELSRSERARLGRLSGPMGPRPPKPALTTQEAQEQISSLLSDSRQALSERDDERAVRFLIDAEQLLVQHREQMPASLSADVEHLRGLFESVKKFWSAVSDGAFEKTALGEKLQIRQRLLTLEARAGDELTFTLDGARQILSRRRLPPDAAVVFALRSFGPDDAWGQAHCAAFLAVDSKSSGQRLQRDARNLAREAVAKLGSAASVLQREFGSSLQMPTEVEPLAKAPAPPPAPAPSTPESPTPPPAVAPAAPPVVLDSPAFREAKLAFDAKTRDFRRLVFAAGADQAALLTEWEPQLAAAQAPLERYLRLELALQIAAKAGDCPRIMTWGAEAAQLLGQPAVEQQGRFLLLCTPQKEEQRQAYFELLTSAINQAESLAKFELALHLAAHGKQAALNARQSIFVQQFTDRAKALEQLQKSRAAEASSALLPPLRRG